MLGKDPLLKEESGFIKNCFHAGRKCQKRRMDKTVLCVARDKYAEYLFRFDKVIRLERKILLACFKLLKYFLRNLLTNFVWWDMIGASRKRSSHLCYTFRLQHDITLTGA